MTNPNLLTVTSSSTAYAPWVVFHPETLGLVQVGGDVITEAWSGPEKTLGMISVSVDDPVANDPAPLVQRAYLDLCAQASALGQPHLLRIWQFIPGINQGEHDQERYRRFCVGRAWALAEIGLSEQRMCAATAIGCQDEVFRLFALVGQQKGQSIENPRQVSAWQYPPQYGPASPAFARATAVNLNGVDDKDGVGLLISGTASVVGHASAHHDDVAAQTQEALINVEAVLREAQSRQPALPDFHDKSYIRVYVRHATDWPQVEAVVRSRWPSVRLMGLLGDICREELLVEVEVWHPSQTP